MADTTKEFTEEQIQFTQRFKNLVGDILSVVDAAIPDGNQQAQVKKLMNRNLYDALEDFLHMLPYPYGTNV
ncbi:MAG: hypothetical protein ABIC57_01565 [bacterium]